MAYSDYGGYAYRNGQRVIERSDATITPEGDTYGTPGSYPRFALLAAGESIEEVQKKNEWPKGHAILGDGPIYVVLRKQYANVFRGPEQIHSFEREDYQSEDAETYVFSIDGYTIDIVLTYEDNFYVYARLTQPDGNVWHGWSGYGVGAGLEDAGYGFSTDDRENKISEIWPESIIRG